MHAALFHKHAKLFYHLLRNLSAELNSPVTLWQRSDKNEQILILWFFYVSQAFNKAELLILKEFYKVVLNNW